MTGTTFILDLDEFVFYCCWGFFGLSERLKEKDKIHFGRVPITTS